MNASIYTVTLTAAHGGRKPHAFRNIEATDAYDAIIDAYRERHGDDVSVTRRDIHTRNVEAGEYVIYGTAGAITFIDVETVEATVSADKVWRAAGRSGSGWAKRDAFGFAEVFQSNAARELAAGTRLFRITP